MREACVLRILFSPPSGPGPHTATAHAWGTEYLNLARAVGALGYTAYPGDTPYNDTDRHSSPAARYQARSVSLAPDPARVAEWAVEAVAASAQCRRHQSQGARAPPREAFA